MAVGGCGWRGLFGRRFGGAVFVFVPSLGSGAWLGPIGPKLQAPVPGQIRWRSEAIQQEPLGSDCAANLD